MRRLNCIANFLRVCRKSLGKIQFLKNGRKNKRGRGQGLEVFITPLAGVAVFLRSVENLSDVQY
jgi:hypothetical protein